MQYTKALNALFILLLASQVATGNDHSLENLLVVADTNSIRAFDLNNQKNEVIANIGGFSIDYDCSTNELFWLSTKTQEIYGQGPNDLRPRVVVPKRKNWNPIAIAVDSITHKLYVADQASGTVSLYDLDSSKFTVIINSNLTRIYGMAIDLNEGYLFVHDEFNIIRTDLNGENRRIIFYEDIELDTNGASSSSSQRIQFVLPIFISRIEVDLIKKRLYWADLKTQEIVSVNYEGTDKTVHFQVTSTSSSRDSRSDYDSITVIDNTIYWSNNKKQIYKIDINAKDKTQFTLLHVEAHSIKAVSCSKRPKVLNPCKKNNGGCQDLCIVNKKENFKCACKLGYELADDKKSCLWVQDYIVFAMEQRLRGLSISNDEKPPVDVIDPGTFNVQYHTNLDTDAENGIVFWNSLQPHNMIHKIKLNSGLEWTFEPNELSSSVTKFTFDWVSRNLYYFTLAQPTFNVNWKTISVLNVDNPTYSKIVINKVKDITVDILVHPNRGYLYFAQIIESNGRITRAGLDGSNPTIIYKKRNKQVISMALDFENDRLYWVEASNLFSGRKSQLLHSNLEGKDIKSVEVPDDYVELNSIAIHGNFIYAIAKEKSLIRFNKLGSSQQLTILSEYSRGFTVTDIQISSLARQTPSANHPCARGHQCQKFCFTVPNENGGIKGVCGCPYGEMLASNGKSCNNNRHEPAIVPYRSHIYSPLDLSSLGFTAPAA